MSAPANARERRLIGRFEILISADAQPVAAQPDPVTTAASRTVAQLRASKHAASAEAGWGVRSRHFIPSKAIAR